MKKLHLLKTVLLLCALIVGSGTMWADEVTIASFSNSSHDEWTINGNPAYSKSGGYQLVANTMSIVSPSIQWSNYTDIKIKIKARKYGGPNATQGKISVSQSETELLTVSPSSTSLSDYGPTGIEPVDGTITISCPGASQSKGCGVSEIIITGTETSGGGGGGDTSTLDDCDLALTGAPVALNFDLYNNSTAQTINYTTSSTGAVTIAKSDYATFDIDEDNKTITVTPTAKTSEKTITVNQAADATYKAGSATFTLTITDSTPKAGAWELVNLADLTGDDVFVIVGNNGNTYALSNNNGTGSAPSAVAVTIEGDEITSDVDNNIKWTISGNADGGYTFYPYGDTDKWLYCTNSNNGVRVGVGDAKHFTLSSGGYLTTTETDDQRYLGVYNSQDWRCYKKETESNIKDQSFAIYKYVNNAAVKNPVITVDESFIGSTTATITCATEGAAIKYSYDGEIWNEYTEALTITETTTIYAKAVKNTDESAVVSKTTTKVLPTPTVTISGDLTVDLAGETDVNAGTLTAAVTYNDAAVEGAVTWSSSDPTIATIGENTGVVTLKKRGTVTFTATYAGNSDYAEATGTKEITVIDSKAPGSQANPYKVSDITAEEEGVYVQGIISSITEVSTGYKNATYMISEDGTTTNEFTVFRGRYLDNADFTSEDQIAVGDAVVIYGDITTHNEQLQLAQGNYLVSRTEKPASDLAKTSDVALDFKNAGLTANIADHISSSSTGAYTYESADETIATVTSEGVVTGLKVGTTTITVNQAATLSYKAGTVEIPVTVDDTRVAATTIPAINISSLADNDEGGTISVVNPVKADEGVTFSFESSDEDVLLIEGNEYIVVGIGTATVTVTATASNSNLYKNVTETFEVTVNAAVKSENVIALDFESYSTVYGTNLEGLVGGSTGFDGTITATSSNPSVLTVAVDAEGNVTITPAAVGSAIVTFSAAETASFLAAEDVEQEFTVTAPEGTTVAPANGFVKVTATEDITDGEYLIVYENGAVAFDGSLETLDKSSNTISVEINDGVIAATNDTKAAIFTIDVTAGTIQSKSGYYIGKTAYSNGLDSNAETQYTNSFEIDGSGNAVITASGKCVMKYNKASDQARFRYYKSDQQDIQLYKLTDASETVTLNAYGYATYCSQYPLDFSDYKTAGYTAWQITGVSGTTITFKKITGSIKGGQGVLLKGEAGETISLTSVGSEYLLEDNMLVGSTAPTYITATSGDYTNFGLKGNAFIKANDGVLPANKAYLPILTSLIPSSSEARLSFVFNDDETTTGIADVRSKMSDGSYYDLQGRKVNGQLPKGLYIVNGKKMVVK